MLEINQTYLTGENQEEIDRLEKVNHDDSFEYLPEAKGKTYSEIINGQPVSFLSIKVTAYNGEPAESTMIQTQESQSFIRLLSQIRLFTNYKELTLISASYKESINKSKEEGMVVNALVKTYNNQPIPNTIINDVITQISSNLKFSIAKNKNIDEQQNFNNNINSNQNLSNTEEDFNTTKQPTIDVDEEGHPKQKFYVKSSDGDSRSFNEQIQEHVSYSNSYNTNKTFDEVPQQIQNNQNHNYNNNTNSFNNILDDFDDEEDDFSININSNITNSKNNEANNFEQNDIPLPEFVQHKKFEPLNKNINDNQPNQSNTNINKVNNISEYDPQHSNMHDPHNEQMSLTNRPAYGYEGNQNVIYDNHYRTDIDDIDNYIHDYNLRDQKQPNNYNQNVDFDVIGSSDNGLSGQEYQSKRQNLEDLYHNPSNYAGKNEPTNFNSAPQIKKNNFNERQDTNRTHVRQDTGIQSQQYEHKQKNSQLNKNNTVSNIAKNMIHKNQKPPETLNQNPNKMARPYVPFEPGKPSQNKSNNVQNKNQNANNASVEAPQTQRKTTLTKKIDNNNKFTTANGTEGTFIHSIFDGKYGKNQYQENAYMNSNEETPFLNVIDDYIPSFDINELEAADPVYKIYEADEFIQTTSSKQKIRKEFNTVMSYFMENEATSVRRVLSGEIEVDNFMMDVKMYLDKHSQIPEEDRAMFEEKIKNAFFSYYVLTPAIFDPDISDIRVLAPDNINVKVKGKHYTASNLKFINESDFNRFINGLIIKNKIRVNSPILVFTDKDFNDEYILRFNLCLGHINSTEAPYLHIRKVPKDKMSLSKLIDAKMLTPKIAKYLLDKVATSRGLVFSGPSASGKTTLMNALVDYVPKDKSILCIQESEEMFSKIHPNAYFQHMLKDAHGDILIGLSELGKNGLLCDSGYFIIGECKGSEVRDLLRASNTGHKCWCSVHAQSSKETIPRLADYVKYGADYSYKEAVRMLKDLEVIVYIENFKVKEITEIAGYDEDKERIIYRPVYRNPEFFNNVA